MIHVLTITHDSIAHVAGRTLTLVVGVTEGVFITGLCTRTTCNTRNTSIKQESLWDSDKNNHCDDYIL